MDWKTVVVAVVPASITAIASAVVLIWTKSIDAKTRKADREHERASTYEERAWDVKNTALATLIGASYQVLLQAQLAEGVDLSRRRARVVLAMDTFRNRVGGDDGIIGQLLAYAADPVRNSVDDFLNAIETERNRHLMALHVLSRLLPGREEVRTQLRPGPRPDGPDVMTVDVYQRLTELNNAINRQMKVIGDSSQIDIDEVVAQCRRLIDAARNDLRAKPVGTKAK